MMDTATIIAKQMNLKVAQVQATMTLMDEGNTLPFIARYRKEATGGLDDEQLLILSESLTKQRALDDRRATIIKTIEEQGQLDDKLRRQIERAQSQTVLEDLYAPYKPKRVTRASIARARGLEPLAQEILRQKVGGKSAEKLAESFVSEQVPTSVDALDGARDIAAEIISDHATIRQRAREKAWKWGLFVCEKVRGAKDEKGTYKLYYNTEYRLDRLKPHQILAMNRGEKENILKIMIDIANRDWRLAIESVFRPNKESPLTEHLNLTIDDAGKRLLLPALERDIRRTLSEQAEEHAIQVFAKNLQGLLSQPPLAGHVTLGIDPAYRTGCKITVIDQMGKVLETATVYPHPPQKRYDDAVKRLALMIRRHEVTLIAIGNGTASRETERMVAEITSQLPTVHYLIVDEAGASVYSASKLAREELPELDVSIRGAVSIARRVQDPLAELVKIDPKSIGIGLYQHDVNQKQLSESLTGVVELVVNRVGVDVNTASPALLTYVAGIGPTLAKRMVEFREKNGRFANRQRLLKVKGLGPKAFEQSAGFLRINDGANPLDASAIHPESYEVATAVLQRANLTPDHTLEERETAIKALRQQTNLKELAQTLQVGVPTLHDILEQLVRPGRDPREDMPTPILRSDVLKMEDLKEGMRVTGTVRNVVDFGAFIDIGVKQDGLLHKSQIPRREQLMVGDVVEVSILSVDFDRQRISLGWPS